MKKTILLALCLALAGLLAVNGTFAAEFTQAVSETVSQLFKTVGELINPEPTAAPSSFKVSVVYLDDSSTEEQVLFPGSTVERRVAVKNESAALPAYFRIAFAVQEEAFSCVTLDFSKGSAYTWLGQWRDITIGGQDYKLMIGTYTDALEAGATSPASLLSVAMNKNVTSEQMGRLGRDFLQMKVLAINADDFVLSDDTQMSATEALDKALPIDDANFNPFI